MKKSATKDDRVYIRINSKLKKRMEAYAKRHNTSLSAISTRFYENLLKHEDEERLESAKKKFF